MKGFRTVITIIILLGFLVQAFEYGRRYMSWSGLSRTDLTGQASSYIERYGVSGHLACLYVVACTEDDTALLSIVTNIDGLDIAALKKRMVKTV